MGGCGAWGLPWGGRPHCLALCCRLPFPGLAAAGGGHVGRWPRVTRASRASHVLSRDHGGEGQGDWGDPGAVQHHLAPSGATPSGHQGLRRRDQRYAAPTPYPQTPTPPSSHSLSRSLSSSLIWHGRCSGQGLTPQPTVGLEAVQCWACSPIFRSLQEPALKLG